MIFYFTGTGNSKYAAERIAEATEDHLVSLREAVRSRRYRYDVSQEERIGFVAPVYFCGLPSILNFFLEKLSLSGYTGQYVYCVFTCGNMTGNVSAQLAKRLEKMGVPLDARFGVQMVDNYVPSFKMADTEEVEKILDAAEPELDEICRVIRGKGIGDYDRFQGRAPGVTTAVGYPMYAHGRSTKPFVVTEACIDCGLCQAICPCGAITITDDRPRWTKPKCVRCLACLHRCPTEAIRWKDANENQGRYVNPRVEL